MRLRKLLMLPAVVSLSAIFAFGTVAQQEDGQVNDKVRELQEQYRRLLKDEYNPSTIEPKTNGKPSFGSDQGWMKSSKSGKGKKSKYGKSAKKKSRSRKAASARNLPRSIRVRSSQRADTARSITKGRSGKLSRTASKKHTGKKTPWPRPRTTRDRNPQGISAKRPESSRKGTKASENGKKVARLRRPEEKDGGKKSVGKKAQRKDK